MPSISLSCICLIHNHVNDRGGGKWGEAWYHRLLHIQLPALAYIKGSQTVGPGPQGGLKLLMLIFFYLGGVGQSFIVENRMCEGLA